MTEQDYRDADTLPAAFTNMWAQVLMQAIHDATAAPKSGKRNVMTCFREIELARNYLTIPNRDFNEVCHMAGLEPEAVRERAIKLIAASPSPEQLAGIETVH